MRRNYLVSVIIPVFNVKEYLEECIGSVLSQDYHNLEVIIVDDGSTDGSGRICDEYKRDERVRVIHKENGGLANARNAGIDASRGEYITFIDSDDFYIKSHTISSSLEAMQSTGSDISAFHYTSRLRKSRRNNAARLMTPEEAISTLFDENGMKFFACNKIFRRDLFDGIRFPEGNIFEDIITIYKVFRRSHMTAYTSEELYFYRQRNSSISRSPFVPGKTEYLAESADFVMNDARVNYPGSCSRMIPGYSVYLLTFMNKAILARICFPDEERHLVKIIRQNFRNIIFSPGISTVKKVMLLLYGISPSLYAMVYRALKLLAGIRFLP